MNKKLDKKSLKIAKGLFKILEDGHRHFAKNRQEKIHKILAETSMSIHYLESLKHKILKIEKFYDKPYIPLRNILKSKWTFLHNDVQYYFNKIQACQSEYLTHFREFQTSSLNPPVLRNIYEEIYELEEDFTIELNKKDKELSVTTNRDIILEGINFGQFKIIFNLNHRSLKAEAVNPLYDLKDNDYYHPHVDTRGSICLGDGMEPIALAIKEYRFADMFNLVVSVLMTYNPSDCYANIELWDEDASYCKSCEEIVSELTPCSRCKNDVCEGCLADCSYCGEYICGNCINYCRECDCNACTECLTSCGSCGRYICPDCTRFCNDCGDVLCENCIQVCECCEEITCEYCSKICTDCENTFCRNCQEDLQDDLCEGCCNNRKEKGEKQLKLGVG